MPKYNSYTKQNNLSIYNKNDKNKSRNKFVFIFIALLLFISFVSIKIYKDANHTNNISAENQPIKNHVNNQSTNNISTDNQIEHNIVKIAAEEKNVQIEQNIVKEDEEENNEEEQSDETFCLSNTQSIETNIEDNKQEIAKNKFNYKFNYQIKIGDWYKYNKVSKSPFYKVTTDF